MLNPFICFVEPLLAEEQSFSILEPLIMFSSITGPCFSCRAAGLFFFSAFLVNLLAGILFLLGSNVAIVCDDLPDYKLLQKVSALCNA